MKKILLSGKEGKEKFVLVDDDIFEEVNKYKWYLSHGYARCTAKDYKLLHRYIWTLKFGDIPDNKEVEHISRDKLNCQISNLRLATRKENLRNRSKYKNNTSGYIGVCKSVKKYKDIFYLNWQATWKDEQNKIRNKLFSYDNVGKVRAARYRDLMVKQIYGDFCGELNFASLEDYQKALKQAILKDLEEN